jgi:hypothetical protein
MIMIPVIYLVWIIPAGMVFGMILMVLMISDSRVSKGKRPWWEKGGEIG